MMQTDAGATERKVHSSPLRMALPEWLQSFGRRRTHEDVSHGQAAEVEAIKAIKALQRDAVRYLTSRQHVSAIGDFLAFGVSDRSLVRSMASGLEELGLDDARVLALDAKLTPALRQAHWLRKASFVWIGRDLHASTLEVLRSAEPLMVDTVVIFERWNEHEEAFAAFLRAHPALTARTLPSDATVARSFAVTRASTV